MVAQEWNAEGPSGDERGRVIKRIGPLPQSPELLERSGLAQVAKQSLIAVIEWAVGGDDEEATDILGKIQEIEESAVAAAWYARSFGYTEGHADSTEEIRRLQQKVQELENRQPPAHARLIACVERNNALLATVVKRLDRIERTA